MPTLLSQPFSPFVVLLLPRTHTFRYSRGSLFWRKAFFQTKAKQGTLHQIVPLDGSIIHLFAYTKLLARQHAKDRQTHARHHRQQHHNQTRITNQRALPTKMLRLGRRGIILSLFINSLNISLYVLILVAACLNIIEASVNFIILNAFAV